MPLPTVRLRHVWLVLPVLLGSMAMGVLPLRAWDYWWHLVAGRWSTWSGEILSQNQFLYTLPRDADGLSLPWLSQHILLFIHEHVGLSGALLCRNALVGAVLVALSVELRAQHTRPLMMVVTLLGALPIMMATATLGPHLLVWPLCLAILIVMRRLRRVQGSSAWLVLLVPTSLLWAQLHTSFLLPAVLVVMWIMARLTDLGRRWKTNPRGSTIAGCVVLVGLIALAPVTHPAGLFEVYQQLARTLSDPLVMQMSPARAPTLPGLSSPVVALLLYLWLVAGAWFFWQRRRMCDRFDMILFFGFGVFAALQSGGLLWFGIAAPLTLTPYLPGSIEDIVEDGEVPGALQAVFLAVILMLGIAAASTQPGMLTRRSIAPWASPVALRMDQPLAMLVTQDTPLDATRWLVDHPEHRRLFHERRWSGLLLWSLVERDGPTQMVFVDDRLAMPGEQVWSLYESIGQARSAWRLQLEAHEVRAILADPISQAPLFEALRKDASWVAAMPSERYTLFIQARDPEEAP